MRSRNRAIALVIGAAVAVIAVPVLAPTIRAQAIGSPQGCGGLPQWAAGVSYYYGNLVQWNASVYRAKISHTSVSGMSPPAAPDKWASAGNCASSQPSPTSNPTWLPTDHPFPSLTPYLPSSSPFPSGSPSPSATKPPSPGPSRS
ncbi:carbohydrate-binding protein [Plantactinospora sonchi]|uniref:Carbohydrate-binding protein n=1 Tax=Plantactinospora sonchi TaxID=1544735 RepID=A0ABU7RRE1_9ACTN